MGPEALVYNAVMGYRVSAVRRVLWLTWAVLLVARVAAAASPRVVADFDGDGQHDSAVVDTGRSSPVLRIWLSATRAVVLVRSATPILSVGAADLNGDGRDELVAVDGSTRLRVWTVHRAQFERVRPHPVPREGLVQQGYPSVDDAPDYVPPVVTTSTPGAIALIASPNHAPPARGVIRCQFDHAGALRSPALLAPSAPRPPPSSL